MGMEMAMGRTLLVLMKIKMSKEKKLVSLYCDIWEFREIYRIDIWKNVQLRFKDSGGNMQRVKYIDSIKTYLWISEPYLKTM